MGHIKDAIGMIVIILLLIAIYSIPIGLTILNIYNLFAKNQYKAKLVDLLILILGVGCSVILYAEWRVIDWTDALELGGGEFGFHAPIASWHMPTILLFSAIAIIGYTLLRIKKTVLAPLVIVLCMAAMYIGCALSVIWILQLIPNLGKAHIFLAIEGYLMCLFPLNFIISTIALIRRMIIEGAGILNEREQKNQLLSWCDKILNKSSRWPIIAIIFVWPLLGIGIVILTLFGQQPDAIIKAFTETSDWMLSQKISPPSVYYDAHYLCTVAAGGHKTMVKPQRMGVRHGHRIVVNRQLCIANAFEELIQEKTPRFHRFIRHIYDTYGYPISKQIRTPLAADITYLIMKPLEWIFLVILYLVDTKPENRIARQYLPKISQ